MGLKQNTILLAQLPLRYRGGDPGTLRSMWGRTDLRNQTVGEGISSELPGIPYGHLAPSSWGLPYRGGAMSAYTYRGATFTLGALNVAAGVNAEGAATLTFTAGPSQLDLIVSAIGSSTVTFTASATALVALNASGSSTVTFTVGAATLGAIIDAVASALVSFTASATPRATGNMAGNITPFTELSPQNLASAVWSALATANNEPGTMGEKLNDAGAAANPWTEVIESGFTASDILKLIAAATAGKASGAGTATIVFRNVADTEDRITATVDGNGNRTAITYDLS